ncbi:MAG: putative Ig domain-containing protein, partial [Acinetobacter sp.]|nr:putative Ig domain-containing protein [Acinetobacter sp.]
SYVPAETALPYKISFQNISETSLNQIRLVTHIDEQLDPYTIQLNDIKVGDINIHVPENRSSFTSDFDFSGSLGFILRVSAGVDAESRVLTWLIQAIDPATGEVSKQNIHSLLKLDGNNKGSVGYTVQSLETALSGEEIVTQARIHLNGTPPVDSQVYRYVLDNQRPVTNLSVTSQQSADTAQVHYKVNWDAQDDISGIRYVTLYVAENGGDFKIWKKQITQAQGEALFVGQSGKSYEFLAVATDIAGNQETAKVSNAVIPDDGTRQQVLAEIGSNESVKQTSQIPKAAQDRSYLDNPLFIVAQKGFAGQTDKYQETDLNSVLSPFTLTAFASGFNPSQGNVGALAMIELPDHHILVSAGQYRNQLYIYDSKGGTSQKPLFSFDQPIMDMAVDSKGQLWVLTGAELWLLDYSTGQIIERIKGPANEPLTHALIVEPNTDRIYVSSGNGIEIFDINAPENQRWTHFSNSLVSDLAFASDGRLWAVRWTSENILSNIGKTDIISLPLEGKTKGRAELEYTLNGLIDSITFGQKGTVFEGLLFASANNSQQLSNNNKISAKNDNASVWMISLAKHQALQLAKGGSRGESILITHDQRILIAQTNSIDEIALLKAPKVLSSSIQDGAYLPLPLSYATISFDQAMWLGLNGGDNTDVASVLNPENYRFVGIGKNVNQTLIPENVKWDKATNSVILTLPNLSAGQWRIEVSSNLQSEKQTRLEGVYTAAFTTVTDYSAFITIDFEKTRADRLNGTVSYDVKITNIGQDNIKGPLLLLLDPGHYFNGGVISAQQGQGVQDELWLLDIGSYLKAHGGTLKVGETLSGITVSVVKAQDLTLSSDAARLLKFNLTHQIYALPYDNQPPIINYDSNKLSAKVNEQWSLDLTAADLDGNQFQWSVVEAPQGVNISYQLTGQVSDQGYLSHAQLSWIPTVKDRTDSEILIKVVDSRGGVTFKRIKLNVIGANHLPEISAIREITLTEGQSFTQQLLVADQDGDRLTMLVRHLPAGAEFDVSTGMLTWTPAYDQAGVYTGIEFVVSDGKAESRYQFKITVKQGYEKPVLLPVAAQQLREGERFSLQLSGQLLHGLAQYPGYDIELKYSAEWLPSGAILNKETGWLDWTPGFAQAGQYDIPLRLIATYTPVNGGVPVRTVATQLMSLIVHNANAAPQFESSPNWTVLEGSSVRLSVFAFDPDNPGFEPALRTNTQSQAVQMTDIAPSVIYQVSGLPEGATFDPESLEIYWNPGYQQAGIYKVRVVATDDGNNTGTPLSTERIFTINVLNSNRAPEIGDLQSVIVDKGTVLEIPISATDKDGNPIDLQIEGLPSFATYTQVQSDSGVKGIIRFAPQAGHRGDYTIRVIAKDNGDGDINQVQITSKSFAVTVRSYSEAPVINVPSISTAVAGQQIRIPIFVSDMDQDELSYVIQGLPTGAQLVKSNQYGYAEIVWTPTSNQLGLYDLSVQVSDKGLPPANLGYSVPENYVPVPSVTVKDIKIIVRVANAAPELLDIQVYEGGVKHQDNDVVVIDAQEGQLLTWTMLLRDSDQDQLNWYLSQLPRGVNIQTQSLGNGQNQLFFSWLPSMFAAGSSLGSTELGQYNFTFTASDGSQSYSQKIRINIKNVNQQPIFTSVPLQLVYEGETLSFNLLAQDADSDALRYQLVHDENTPEGILVDVTTGYVEWTPTADMVNNSAGDQKAYDLTFMVTDGHVSVLKTVQVRVLDVNKAPTIQSTNRNLLVGREFDLNIIKAAPNSLSKKGDIWVSDADGSLQTQGLIVSFDKLPEGAIYDENSGKLSWIPGPGQIGKFIVYVKVSDGYDTVSQTLTFNVMAEIDAYRPELNIETTPAIPVLPEQIVTATVRTASFSAIASTIVEVRGSAIGFEQWQTVSLDSTGRIKLKGKQPGLIEIRTTVIDIDGFTQQKTETVRVRDPQDAVAPIVSWQGKLSGTSAYTESVVIKDAIDIVALIREQQLMGYKLEIASNKAGNLQWRTLQETSAKAIYNNQTVDIFALDPALLANGAYQLRLTAWDLSGRLEEIFANIEINSKDKQLNIATHVDSTLVLGSQNLDIVRNITKESIQGDYSNWLSSLFETQLTHNQRLTTNIGTVAAWQVGAQVWLQVPKGFTGSTAQQLQYLNFSLGLQQTYLNGANSGILQLRPTFTTEQGWTLNAYSSEQRLPENLVQQGQSLYSESTGLAWVPSYFTLTSPEGVLYLLDQSGQVISVEFTNGEKWLLGQNNIVLVSGKSQQSIEFKRDTQGRISQILGKNAQGEPISLLYRYNSNNQLELVRNLITGEVVQRYSYSAKGELSLEKSKVYLGATVDWMNASVSQPQWQGQISNETQYFDFALRESELASTVKTMGATGAVIIAVETQGDVQDIAIKDATVLSQQRVGNKLITLVRLTSAGFKQLAVTAQGTVNIKLSVAGDMNADGNVDGLDSQLWQQSQTSEKLRDLNGDGVVNNIDLQILYANYGWKTNQAPVNIVANGEQVLKTHTDLTVNGALNQIAVDREGDAVYWNIISSTHGVAQLSVNGKNLSFKPELGFSGYATVTLQADDGYAKGKPIELKIYVSDAKLVLIHIERLAALALGSSSKLQVTGDFTDEEGVVLTPDYLQFISDNPNILSVDAQGNVVAKQAGITTVHVTARGIEGVNAISVSLRGDEPEIDNNGFEVDVYPKAVILPLNGERQLKVTDVDGNKISLALKGTKYYISDSHIAEITVDGLIQAKSAGIALITVINNGHQYSFSLIVQQPDVGSAVVDAKKGAVVQDLNGNVLMVAPGAVKEGTEVSIKSVSLDDVGMPLPAPKVLTSLAAFELDIGDEKAKLPLQLAIKIPQQAKNPQTGELEELTAGTEVFFWKKGTITDAEGTTYDTWWLVDNGVIGNDGVARTASPPYVGSIYQGTYLVSYKKLKGSEDTGAMEVTSINMAAVWDAFFSLQMGIAMAPSPMMAVSALGIFAAATTPNMAIKYTIFGSYQKAIAPEAFDAANISVEFPLPPERMDGYSPTITKLDYDVQSKELTVTGENFAPGGTYQYDIKVWLVPRGDQIALPTESGTNPESGLVWQGYAPQIINGGQKLKVILPDNISLSMHLVYVERILKVADSGGDKKLGLPVDSNLVQTWTLGTDNVLVVTRSE